MDNAKVKAQVSLEFVTAFLCTILLLVLTTQLFVWFGNNIVNRQKAYESMRSMIPAPAKTAPYPAMSGFTSSSGPVIPAEDFYTPPQLNISGKKIK